MRHAPDEHGEHAREETNADGEVRLSVADAAARAEVLLPPIVVGREREPLAPGGRHYCARRLSCLMSMTMSTKLPQILKTNNEPGRFACPSLVGDV